MEKKEEKQKTLDGSIIITSIIPSIISEPDAHKSKLPASAWSILALFANTRTPENLPKSFSYGELRNIFKSSMHWQTIRSNIFRLRDLAWIRLYTENWGKTKTAHRFIITLDGQEAWQKYRDV